jgi:hypothetical protein
MRKNFQLPLRDPVFIVLMSDKPRLKMTRDGHPSFPLSPQMGAFTLWSDFEIFG